MTTEINGWVTGARLYFVRDGIFIVPDDAPQSVFDRYVREGWGWSYIEVLPLDFYRYGTEESTVTIVDRDGNGHLAVSAGTRSVRFRTFRGTYTVGTGKHGRSLVRGQDAV